MTGGGRPACTVLVAPDAEAAGRAAAALVARRIRDAVADRGRAHVMFATGTSQLAFLAALTAEPDLPWADVVGLQMDEYVGLAADHPASFRRYLREHLAGRCPLGRLEVIVGDAADPDAECRRYAAVLAALPLDVCVAGIGENGHLAFCDPHVADFDDPEPVRVVELAEASRRQQVGEGHFPSVGAVPARAITVTIPVLRSARDLVVVAPEARKAAAVAAALTGPVGPTCPASILQRSPQATVFCDADSAAGLPEGLARPVGTGR